MKRFFIVAIALMAMVACNKEDDGISVLDTSKKSVAITISNARSTTKGVTDTAGATNVACTKAEDLVFGFCDGAGKLITALTVADATLQADGSYVFHALDQKISRVYVIANGAGANKITKANAPASYDLAHALWEAQTPHVEWDEIVVLGHSTATHVKDGVNDVFCEVEGYKYPLFAASVKVVPNHARLEVSKIACSDLGNEYNKIALQNLTFAGAFVEQLGTDPEGFMLDAVASPAVTSLTPGAGKVWSWNIKQTEALDLVLNIDAKEGNGWLIPSGTSHRTVTVGDYKAPGLYANTANVDTNGYIKQFMPGEIYSLNLTFKEQNMHNDSDMLCIDVDVQIAEWIIVPVDPVFN